MNKNRKCDIIMDLSLFQKERKNLTIQKNIDSKQEQNRTSDRMKHTFGKDTISEKLSSNYFHTVVFWILSSTCSDLIVSVIAKKLKLIKKSKTQPPAKIDMAGNLNHVFT